MYTSSRAKRLASAVALPVVLLLGVSACSAGIGSDSPSSQPDARQAAKALDAGLKAHAAGDLKEASVDYIKTLTYDKDNKFALYNLALIYEAEGNYGLAETKYRSAIKSDPAYEPALFNLAILRTARNDPEEAIALYQRAVAADKDDAAAWLNLGLLLRDSGEKRAGDKAVLKAIGLEPSLRDPAKQASPLGSSGS
jgi:superkiller protein 3